MGYKKQNPSFQLQLAFQTNSAPSAGVHLAKVNPALFYHSPHFSRLYIILLNNTCVRNLKIINHQISYYTCKGLVKTLDQGAKVFIIALNFPI